LALVHEAVVRAPLRLSDCALPVDSQSSNINQVRACALIFELLRADGSKDKVN
jgi:hypothetical protein